jgi:FecR protein
VADDYLWDGSGPPDPEIERLERLLGRFRGSPPMPAWQAARRSPFVLRPSKAYLAVAASLILGCGLGLWQIAHLETSAWTIQRVAGVPVIDAAPVGDSGRLAVGQWLETDRDARATVSVGDIGLVQVDPHTRVQLLDTTAGNHRLALARGTVHALIWAPPREFFVETPSSTAVDLGCAYTLRVDPQGNGTIDVTAGWVAFEHHGRESFIPAGARCQTRVGAGPGTPYFPDAPEDFQASLSLVDFGERESSERALDDVLARAKSRDAITLWHLLRRVDVNDRGRVFDRLAAFSPPPASVTRDGIVSGDRRMLDDWWDALGLGSTSWWRTWKREWR